jgi:hypothetical protein
MAMLNRKFYWTATTALIFLSVVVPVFPSSAIKYRPSPKSVLERPGGRQGAATRSGDCANKGPLVFESILPSSNQGQTVADYPTFYWYQANQSFTWARFELYATQNQQPESFPIYNTTFRTKGTNAIASMTLPPNAGLPALEVGREYLWKVTLICSKGGPEDETADGSQQSIQGWVTRVSAPATLQTKLAQAQTAYSIYAEEGLWYDAIHDLAIRRRQNPQDIQLANDWRDLLKETALRDNPLVSQRQGSSLTQSCNNRFLKSSGGPAWTTRPCSSKIAPSQ